MFIKSVKIVSALLISFLLLFPVQKSYGMAQTTENHSKIAADLLEKMEDSHQALPVYVWTYDLDFTEMYQQIEEIMGSQWAYEGTEAEWVDWFLSLERAFKRERYAEYNKEILETLGLDKDRCVLKRTDAPMVAVWLIRDEIYRLADNDKVTALYCMDLVAVTVPEEITYPYTAVHALHILQATVGLRMGSINWEYDVDRDGVITTADALLALKHSVRLITITWPDDGVFPE